MKLDERDERILALLGTEPRSLATLAQGDERTEPELAERLADLADNGLVSDLGDDRYERTESGRRVLVSSGAGTADERLDTTSEVEAAIEEFSLRADEADAVRHAYSFLRYWGRVTDVEVVDAVYSEATAGRDSPEAWWNEVVRDRLAALPGVDPPTEDDDAWRFAGTPEISDRTADGRRVLSRTHPVYGDVKHALESVEFTPAERDAARAAFAYLYRRGEVTDRDLRRTVYPERPAGYESATDWWDQVVREAFEALPGVERTGERTWRYRGQ